MIRILIADDHPIVRAGLMAVFALEDDIEVVGEAASADDAVAAAAHSHPNVVLMDLRMPVMDGQSATRAIRALERRDAPRVPIIAMTADAFEESIREAKQAGMNGYVTKPVESAKLYRTLAQLIYGA